MKRIFGVAKPPAPAGPPPPSLVEASESIEKRVASIEGKIKECDDELKKYKAQMTGPGANAAKTRAMTVLRRKKMYESQRDTLLNTQFNVDQAKFMTENMITTAVTVEALKAGAKEIKSQYAKLDIDSIYDTMDDFQDVQFDQSEINDLLSNPYGVANDFDETEFDNELAALEEEAALDKLSVGHSSVPSYIPDTVPSAPQSSSMPSAPMAHSEAPLYR